MSDFGEENESLEESEMDPKKKWEACVYYDEKKEYIIDISPRELDPVQKNLIEQTWNQEILRKILILISQGNTRLPDIQNIIGHSSSTLHGAVQKLHVLGFIDYKMIYKGNKQKLLSSRILCVTKNSKSKIALQRFFQGLWINSTKTKKIIECIQSDKRKWWTEEELSVKTHIPVDEISMLLSNFDSQTTKSLSQMLNDPPFEKKITYKAKKK